MRCGCRYLDRSLGWLVSLMAGWFGFFSSISSPACLFLAGQPLTDNWEQVCCQWSVAYIIRVAACYLSCAGSFLARWEDGYVTECRLETFRGVDEGGGAVR